jgi:sulfate permease, SulP family
MPPEAGLLAFVAGTIGFAVFGTNRFLSAGADSTIAPIFAAGLGAMAMAQSRDYASLASLLALMVGAILIAAALLRAGWIADLLSDPVTTGFFAGIAVHIIIGQLPSVLGIADLQGPLLARIPALLQQIPDANPIAAGIGIFVLAAAQLTERVAPRVPGALLAIALTALISSQLHLAQLGMMPPLAAATPHLALSLHAIDRAPQLLPLALIVAVVCMMQTAAVLRAFPSHKGGPRHVARDFAGVGAGNVLAGLFGGFAVNASPPRTSVVVQAGAGSQLAGLVAIAIVVALVFGDGTLLGFVPHAALGGLLIAIGIRLFHLRQIVRIVRLGGSEWLLVVASAALIIALPIERGMIAAIVLSLLQGFYGVARPLCTELVRAPGTTVWWPSGEIAGDHTPGVLVFAPAAPLLFTNIDYVRNRLADALSHTHEPVRLLIVEASGVTEIDYTASQRLQQTIAALRANGMDVALARLSSERAQHQADRSGLLAAFGPQRVFRSVEDAVQALAHRPE